MSVTGIITAVIIGAIAPGKQDIPLWLTVVGVIRASRLYPRSANPR